MKTNDIPKQAAYNPTVFDAYVKAKSVLETHDSAVCSVSGGKDSDCMMDMLVRLDAEHKIRYVWVDTGLEYMATRRHLADLERKYQVPIERLKAVKSVPRCVKEYGLPFLSKINSQIIRLLQRKGFQWEDLPLAELEEKYHKVRYGLRWWTNDYAIRNGSHDSYWNISRFKGLKEFLIDNPPDFLISDRCCEFAKKKTAAQAEKDVTLKITGVRKAEGGVRRGSYKGCFSSGKSIDAYRPLFWFKSADVAEYSKLFEIRHSDCYEVWGLKRTGCVGCPFNQKIMIELQIIKEYESNMYRACMAIFGKSYEYTTKYRQFVGQMKK